MRIIKKKIVLSAMILLTCSTFAAGVLADSWTRIYGTSPSASGNGGSDIGKDIVSDSSGNYYITGTYNSHLSGGWDTTHIDDVIIAKLNQYGYIVWMNILSSGVPGSIIGDDEGIAIDLDSAGNIYVLGKTNGDISGEGIDTANQSHFIAKLNNNGIQQWIHQFGRIDSNNWSTEFIYDVSVDSAGNSYSIGGGYDPITGNTNNKDAVIYKYDTNGNQVSFTTFPSPDTDFATGSAIDANNNLYLSGWRANPSGGFGDAYETWVKKISSAGTLLWSTESGYLGWDMTSAMTFNTATNEIIVVGNAKDIPFVFSFSPSNGTLIRSTNGNAFKYYHAVDTDAAGNVYVTGQFGKNWVSWPTNRGSDILLTKFSSTGVLLNEAKVGTVNTGDGGLGIVVDGAGNFVITGFVAGDLNGVPSNGATNVSLDIILLENLPQ